MRPRFFKSVSTSEPELGPLGFGFANPEPQHVFGAVAVDAQHPVDRSFTDAPCNLDVDIEGVEINDRVEARRGDDSARLSRLHFDRIGDLADKRRRHLRPIQLFQLQGDINGC